MSALGGKRTFVDALERATALCFFAAMKTGAEHFTELGDWTEEDVRRAGYERRSLSIFDHWLSPEETAACCFFSYHDAVSAGLLPTYLKQEDKFIRFYRIIFAAGAYRVSGWGRRRRTGIAFHSHWDRRLKKAVRSSLRDRIHMDAYSPEFSLRVHGNWDRSDVLLFTDNRQQEVESIARQCGLFVI